MARPRTPGDPYVRKNIGLQQDLWQAVADYRFDNRIGTESEAVRLLLIEALTTHGYLKPPKRRKPE